MPAGNLKIRITDDDKIKLLIHYEKKADPKAKNLLDLLYIFFYTLFLHSHIMISFHVC